MADLWVAAVTGTLFDTEASGRDRLPDEEGRAVVGDGEVPSTARSDLNVVGLDLSLKRTGVATRTEVESLKPPAQLTGFARMRWIRACVVDRTNGADLVVVEAPAYSSNQAYAKEIAGLWHVVMVVIDSRGTRWIDAMSNTLKKYATGNGRCEKPEMVAAAVRRMPWLDVTNDDEADAAWACALGHDLLGAPIADLPQDHRAALSAVRARLTPTGDHA